MPERDVEQAADPSLGHVDRAERLVDLARQLRHLVAAQDLLDEVLLLRGQQLANRLGVDLRAVVALRVPMGQEEVDAVGLALHLVVDPGQVDLE